MKDQLITVLWSVAEAHLKEQIQFMKELSTVPSRYYWLHDS